MRAAFAQFVLDEQGQDLIEYTLLLAFVVGTAALLASGFHENIEGVTTTTNSNLDAATSAIH